MPPPPPPAPCGFTAYGGQSYDCGFGTQNQNWFGGYRLGSDNPYRFVSSMPYGYGSGAQPLYNGLLQEGLPPGTVYGPAGYYDSSVNAGYYPNTIY